MRLDEESDDLPCTLHLPQDLLTGDEFGLEVLGMWASVTFKVLISPK